MAVCQDLRNAYPFLPPLVDLHGLPEFASHCPVVAGILSRTYLEVSHQSSSRITSPRRRLLERAVAQVAQVEEPAALSPALPISDSKQSQQSPESGGDEDGLLALVQEWMEEERCKLRGETEGLLHQVFASPAAERRAVVEVQRQKWRAIEEACLCVERCIENVPTSDPLRKRKVTSALRKMSDAENPNLREKVRILWDVAAIFDYSLKIPPRDGLLHESQSPTGGDNRRIDESDYAAKVGDRDRRTHETTARATDVAALKNKQEEAATLKSQKAAHRLADQLNRAANAQRQAGAKAAMPKGEHQGDKESAQEQRWASERETLVWRMRTGQLQMAAAALHERQELLSRTRSARLEAFQAQWFSEADVTRAGVVKQLIIRRTRTEMSKNEHLSAHAIGQVREWLFRCRERIGAGSGKDPAAVRSAISTAEQNIKKEFDKALDSVGQHKQRVEVLMERLCPDHSKDLASRPLSGGANIAPAVVEKGLAVERELAESARLAAAERLREAEKQLDDLAEEDISADFAMRWSEKVSTAAREARATQKKMRALQEEADEKTSKDVAAHRRLAEAARAESAASAARSLQADASSALRRKQDEEAAEKEKARIQEALQEAEKHRLVPVKVKVAGLRISHIKDVDKFSKAFGEQVRNSLQLDESEFKVKGISGGTG
eukprot:TRINITY_DN10275_c0_g1_i4.p1 TRINITY_DN10275_c0_g1~~TRINITY_DN10275_c0_g1_i4.p1  ORF type:complete len:667 (-),score=161.07 TRINITY_DN10275_c0_g1_i4:40-2040(-)